MSWMTRHLCLDISGALKEPKQWVNCISVEGKLLTTVTEVKAFFNEQLVLGHRVLPMCDCDNFDYQTGCRGHKKEGNDNDQST